MKSIIYLFVLLTVILIFSGCDSRNPVGTGYNITLISDRDTLHVGDAINNVELTSYVSNDQGESISGVQVHFTTDFGSVLGTAITDDNGFAFSTYWYDGLVTGTAKVKAQYAGVEAEIKIYIVDPNPYILELWATPDTLWLGSGQMGSTIHAHLTDREGIPLSGERIDFSTEGGFVTGYDITSSNGYAEATFLYGGSGEGTVEISASYMEATAMTFIYVLEPDIVILNIWSEEDTIYAGTNNNYTRIFASLTDGYDNPVVDAYVYFSASTGSIDPYGITDNYGLVDIDFWFSERQLTATITGSYEGILDMITIEIMPLTFQIESVTSDSLAIYADNDIETFATITVLIHDSGGFPASDKLVHFSTTLGYISLPNVETGDDGKAITYLHDNDIAGLAHVTITCENDESYIDIMILEARKRKQD
ncbi:MAG: hypothetical protein K9N06_08930 [Candidatus Cloacimonetes bacterium]|nr:hypothetical protein [Candidatus Cloacimonadota bacterium]